MTSDRWLLLASALIPLALALILYAARKWVQDIVVNQNMVLIGEEEVPINEVISKIHKSLEERNGGSSVRDLLVFTLDAVKDGNKRMDRHMEDHAYAQKVRRSG